MTNFPELFIAGVPKAGTSSLYNWLDAHPQVQGSFKKETCFFADPDSHTFDPGFNFRQGLGAYASAFPVREPNTRIQFEATPTYIYSKTALAEVPRLPSDPKCLFVLREPASQIQSTYRYFRDNWAYIPSEMSFEAFLEAARSRRHEFAGNELCSRVFEYADYLPWLEKWRDALGRDRMKVVTFDQLSKSPRPLLQEISEWVGVDPAFYEDFDFVSENETYTPRNRLLQRINIAVRGHLPKGRAYALGRRLYRRLNTTRPERVEADAMLQELRREFAPSIAGLEQAFDLDLKEWKP